MVAFCGVYCRQALVIDCFESTVLLLFPSENILCVIGLLEMNVDMVVSTPPYLEPHACFADKHHSLRLVWTAE